MNQIVEVEIEISHILDIRSRTFEEVRRLLKLIEDCNEAYDRAITLLNNLQNV